MTDVQDTALFYFQVFKNAKNGQSITIKYYRKINTE